MLVKKTVWLLAITVPVPCSLNESAWNWMLSLAELTRAELRNRPEEEEYGVVVVAFPGPVIPMTEMSPSAETSA